MASAGDKFARLAALRPAAGRTSPIRPAALRPVDEEDGLAPLIGAGVGKNRYGEHLAVQNWFATPEYAEASSTSLDLLSRTKEEAVTRRVRAALENPENWLFLDTETTGLAGGTGTYAFLVGIAWWDAGGMQVEQLFMRDFTEEYSLLYELAGRIAERPVLVTFNGKSFDWPLLENRYTMTRAISTPKLAAHLDLLHPARALWKLRLGSVRLVELEKHVLDGRRLGWHRENDVDSAMIPQFYFDYLRGGQAEPLAGVVRHNQMDLRGLGALFGKMNEMLTPDNEGEREIESLDLFGLSRYLQRRGAVERAERECARALERGLPAEHRGRARRELAQLAKRGGDHERAVECWQELLADAENCAHACEQLASYYERREKDFAMAAEVCELALRKLETKSARLWDSETERNARAAERILRRLTRLRKRMRTKLNLPAKEAHLAKQPNPIQ